MDELFEILTLIQTGKSEKIPIVLVGKEYWDGLFDWLTKIQLEKFETISAGDLDMFTIVNTAKEAYDLIKDSKDRTFF